MIVRTTSLINLEEYAIKAQFNLPSTPETEATMKLPRYEKKVRRRISRSSLSRSHLSLKSLAEDESTKESLTSTTNVPSTTLPTHSISRSNSHLSLRDSQQLNLDMDFNYNFYQFNPFTILRNILSGHDTNLRPGSILHMIVISLLLCGTVTDLAMRMSANSNSSPNDDGVLSTSNKKGSGLLGSAMISSVTGVLSPILPFAGGVDLRRDDNWKTFNYWDYFSSLGQADRGIDSDGSSYLSNSNDNIATSIPRGGGQTRRNKKNRLSSPVLSATDPFLSANDISEMTLREVSYTFHYVVEAGRVDFEMNAFLSEHFEGEPVTERMEKAIHAMEAAVKESRGNGVYPSFTNYASDQEQEQEGADNDITGALNPNVGFGDIDALRFCAHMRILAEWRVLRQVPPGFKGYAVGMTLGHKDVVQNLGKIEIAVHDWIENQILQEGEEPRSPTIRELLQYEVDTNVHPNHKLPRLKEKSAAMGLLWVRRQLHYQTSIFSNIISIPHEFPTSVEAVGAAYTEVYGDIHGWTVQKIFNYSFQAAPQCEKIFCHMNPRRLEKVRFSAVDAASSYVSDDFETDDNEEEYEEDSSSDDADTNEQIRIIIDESGDYSREASIEEKELNPFLKFFDQVGSDLEKVGDHIGGEWDKFGKHVTGELDKFGHHVGGEWDKVVCNVNNIIKHKKDGDCNQKTRPKKAPAKSASKQRVVQVSDLDVEQYISKEMAEDAKIHIVIYLNIAKPLLTDLAGLFDEMNMDDPTKV